MARTVVLTVAVVTAVHATLVLSVAMTVSVTKMRASLIAQGTPVGPMAVAETAVCAPNRRFAEILRDVQACVAL